MMTERPARLEDVHELALAMPHVTVVHGRQAQNPIYQVGGRSFVFFRTPRPAPTPSTPRPAIATTT